MVSEDLKLREVIIEKSSVAISNYFADNASNFIYINHFTIKYHDITNNFGGKFILNIFNK